MTASTEPAAIRMKWREQQLADLFLENGASLERLAEVLRQRHERRRELESRIRLLSRLVPSQLEKERTAELPELLLQLKNRSLADSELPPMEILYDTGKTNILDNDSRLDFKIR